VDLDAYQQAAKETDMARERRNGDIDAGLVVPVLGLAGEVGELLSEIKKRLRDGDSHLLHNNRVKEELGDLLWYASNVASKFDLSLEDIARTNLEKTRNRWHITEATSTNFDEGYPENESLPRRFRVELRHTQVGECVKLQTFVEGEKVGDDLTDNAHDPDGYRFHDVFHISYATVLGWSPVIRKLLNRKRRGNAKVDEVEDGGRAVVVDEAISALVFEYAREHNWLFDVASLDYHLLRTIKGMTCRLEVRERTMGEWQSAILSGFAIWREIRRRNGGEFIADLDARQMILTV
jgi:NTP pyrophosphatase (non-canonical NTP hydrolase)